MKEIYDKIVPCLADCIEYNQLSEKEYIICNVNKSHYVKINQNVYRVLSLIDGNKDLECISKFLKEINEIEIPPHLLYALLYEKLAPYGIIKGFDNQNDKETREAKLFEIEFYNYK